MPQCLFEIIRARKVSSSKRDNATRAKFPHVYLSRGYTYLQLLIAVLSRTGISFLPFLLFGISVVRSDPFSHRIPRSDRWRTLLKLDRPSRYRDSLKREKERRERERETFGRLLPRRCNADNPALLISRPNLPGTCSVITSRRRITFLARISAK